MDNTPNFTSKSLSSDEINKIEEFRRSKHTAVLAILFSDIVNSTYATENLGEQSFSKLRHIHDELFIKIMCRDNAGVIIKQIGDSFLCVFAEPSTSVLRAVEFQRAIRRNKDHLTIKGYTLTVRMGIHIGQVVVENMLALDIFGSHVNRAARIESIANGGQIITSQSVWENAVGWLKNNTEEEIGWISYGKTRLKGIDGKIDIFGFYPKEIGPSPVPKIFRKQRLNRTLLGLTSLLLLAVLVFFLVKNINQKGNNKGIVTSTPQRKSFYIQFDFSKISNLDTSSLKDIFISQIITALYPDSVVTESDLIKSYSKQGKLYKRHVWGNPNAEKYFRDTLNLSGALFVYGINLNNEKNDSISFNTILSFWTDKGFSASDDGFSSSVKDLKHYFQNWIQDKLTRLHFNDEQGIVLESNDSIVLFHIAKEANLSQGAAISISRIYSQKEGLRLWLSEHGQKIEYLKDKPQFAEDLKNENIDFESHKAEVTDDLANDKSSWTISLNIYGKVIELYDSIGKATWKQKGVFPFVKPQKGDLISLNY